MGQKAEQLFEYLLSVKNLGYIPNRSFTQYEKSFFIDDLPTIEGCYIYGNCNDDESWLEIHKQTIDPVPEPSYLIRDWVRFGYKNPLNPPEVDKEKKYTVQNLDNKEQVQEKVVLFEEDDRRVTAFNEWNKEWQVWAERAKKQQKVQDLYGFFFSLYQRLEREGENLELAFGHGLLSWDHNREKIHHPILVTKMELIFDPKKGVFSLKPGSKGTFLDINMLAGLELPNQKILYNIRNQIDQCGMDPWDESVTTPFYKEYAQTLHEKGTFEKGQQSLFRNYPTITENPIIFLRQRSGQIWRDELRNSLEYIRNGGEVPKPILSITQMDPIEQTSIEKLNWSPVGEDLLFPLPANEDQKEIARRLSNNFGITVQGPPGTGKSHTIANLISHLLAHGKKVLVTSQTEKALRVLTEKIPEEIRSLCVPVMGGDTRSMQEIEDSIRAISEKMDSQDLQTLSKNIVDIQEDLRFTRVKMTTYKDQLKQMVENEHQICLWKGEKWSSLDVAKYLTEQKGHNWLTDSISFNTDFPLSEEEFLELWSLRDELNKKDCELADQFLPELETLYSPDQFKDWMEKGTQLRAKAQETKGYIDKFSIPVDQGFLTEALNRTKPLLNQRELFQTPHLQPVLKDMIAGGERYNTWEELEGFLRENNNEISQLHRSLSEHEITLPEVEWIKLKKDIEQFEQKLLKGKIGKFYLMTTGKKIRYLVEHPILNGQEIETLSDLNIIKDYIIYIEKKRRLVKKWNTIIQSVEGPLLDAEEPRLIAKVDDHASQIRQCFQLAEKIKEASNLFSQQLNLPSGFSFYSYESYEDLYNHLQYVDWHIKHREWEEAFEKEKEKSRGMWVQEESHSVCFDLVEALTLKDSNRWIFSFDQVCNLVDLQKKHNRFNELLNILKSTAPNWAHFIGEYMDQEMAFPLDWRQAWEWSRLNTWLKERSSDQMNLIESKIRDEEANEKRLIGRLVAASTWQKQIQRTTEKQKRALQAWKQKIKRIGKGTGKYAEKFRREAREEMEQCQGAIPVWIMPVHRVIESISLYNEKFDVVIVDESSQSDLFSLSVLLRAHRAVIVGDDEQISPSAVGVDQEKVRNLIHQFLQGIPQANSLDMQTSLYDVASRVFPGKLMLKEHFRCVPEIIQFSNDLSYGGQIISLRLPTAKDRIEPSIVTKNVIGYRNEGTRIENELEADSIVKDIKMLLDDPAYEGRTMGVITLLGSHQASLIENKIREEIGEEQMLARKIVCGDAYSFQGDERDIIFLSMVVANNVRYMAQNKKDAQQRYNVAVSRAKNQLRLYHSVDLSDLNPNDLRFRLLNYCQNPLRVLEKVEEAEKKCESKFEVDVLRMILAKGYQVRPQVQVGHKRIDMVVEGIKNRLAIECDGDNWHGIEKWEEDMERQRVLERAGWTFWRVRGSAFYRDPNKAMESLWQTLEEMGIEKEAGTVLV